MALDDTEVGTMVSEFTFLYGTHAGIGWWIGELTPIQVLALTLTIVYTGLRTYRFFKPKKEE